MAHNENMDLGETIKKIAEALDKSKKFGLESEVMATIIHWVLDGDKLEDAIEYALKEWDIS